MSQPPKPADNDPWSPLLATSGAIQQPPADPRYQLIDSGRYIESLEKKLGRIRGKQKKEPSSKDIIDSLALFQDDQMRRFIEKESAVPSSPFVILDEDHTAAVSYIQRRLHPERQAVNVEELFELLKDDQLAKVREEMLEEEEEEEAKKTQTDATRPESVPTAEQPTESSAPPAEGNREKDADCDSNKMSDSTESDR